jgi:hypothetical protein
MTISRIAEVETVDDWELSAGEELELVARARSGVTGKVTVSATESRSC